MTDSTLPRTTPRLLDLLPDYEAHLVGKGHRPRGRASYLYVLRRVIRHLGEEATVADLTEDRITDYRNMRAQTIKPASVFNELVCIRSLCAWCVRKRLLPVDPTQYVDYPKVPNASPRALSRAQLKQLFVILAKPAQSHKRTWQRNRLTILLMLYAGLRLSEAADLRWVDVDLDARNITIRDGKNGKTRAVPIHLRLLDELEKELDRAPERAVITNGRGAPMGRKMIARVFERWLATRGLKIHAHMLRHTFSTEMLRAGAPLTDIQAALGHDSIETTMVYLTIDSDHLRGSVDLLPSGW